MSYEVSIGVIIIRPLLYWYRISVNYGGYGMINRVLLLPLLIVWLVTLLAETNRTPFDLAEGESELVSGFNTEYGSGAFALIFIAEYTSILALRIIRSFLFFNGGGEIINVFLIGRFRIFFL